VKILFIAYLFPPHGGGGVLRAAKLCKYLPDFGITPVVLCADDKYFHTRDETLLEEIPQSVEVNRVEFYQAPRPTPAMRKLTASRKGRLPLFTRLRKFFAFPDPNGGYRRAALAKGDELLAEGDYSAILSTYPPPSTHIVAAKLAAKWNLPLILDYLEKDLLKKADKVITIGDGLAADFKRYYPFLDEVGIITNGFDEEDFAGISPVKRDKFTVAYVGSLHGGRLPGTFLSGAELCISKGLLDKDSIEFRVIGSADDNVAAYVNDSGIRAKIVGRVDHRAAISEMLSADANLLIIDEGPGANTILTGKIFEYLRAGRPIIAVVPPEGEAAELIRHFDAGYVIAPGDAEKASQVISELYERYRIEGTGAQTGFTDDIMDFSRKSLAKRYADVIRDKVEQ